MDRRRFLAGMGAAGAAPLAGLPLLAATASSTTLTATDVHVKDYPTVEAVRWIGETLERETQGRLRI
ncbi:MAG TPA: TRAP transporter substrate-binding protein, partial [Pseudoxanthomonas sp.]|nr:TRAP transporter substrate-binding protein [Pseudoxanthomonas sp.]